MSNQPDQSRIDQSQIDASQTAQPSRSPILSPGALLLIVSALMGVIASILVLIASGAADEPQNPDDQFTRPLRDWQAADFELVTLEGEPISLSDYRGRPVFLNFWRTDCAPCVRELPAFAEFTAEQGEDGAVILAANQGEEAARVGSFLEEIGVSGLTVVMDPDVTLLDDYPARNLPTTYVIDAAGEVQFFKIGELTTDDMYSYLDALAPNTRG